MTQIETIIAEIERRIEQFKEERSKVPPTTPKSVDRLSLGARIAALEETLVFIQSLPAEQPSEEFKGEFEDYLVHGDIRNPNFDGPFGYDDIRKTAIHFANWKKEQMMKNCLYDTEVLLRTKQNNTEYLTLAKDKLPHIPVSLGLNVGDKVKVIIVKEDEQ